MEFFMYYIVPWSPISCIRISSYHKTRQSEQGKIPGRFCRFTIHEHILGITFNRLGNQP